MAEYKNYRAEVGEGSTNGQVVKLKTLLKELQKGIVEIEKMQKQQVKATNRGSVAPVSASPPATDAQVFHEESVQHNAEAFASLTAKLDEIRETGARGAQALEDIAKSLSSQEQFCRSQVELFGGMYRSCVGFSATSIELVRTLQQMRPAVAGSVGDPDEGDAPGDVSSDGPELPPGWDQTEPASLPTTGRRRRGPGGGGGADGNGGGEDGA